jgi:hypothetical protein
MVIGNPTPAIFQEALRRLPGQKAPGPDNIPGVLLKHMPPAFHKAICQLFQTMAITGTTPPNWLLSNTILLYKKNDPYNLDNYRPITLANVLYKLWASCLSILAMDYIEANKIISPEQEGFRPGRSCSRAITHLSLCIEDAHTHNKDILLAYLDFTQAFPSTDHLQLERTLRFLGIPEDFISIVANLYKGAHTTFETPYGKTRQIPVLRGTLQGDPLSPLLFLLMVEPLIRWLKSLQKGYTLTSNKLNLASKWYADDATLIAHNVSDLNTQLDVVNTFS